MSDASLDAVIHGLTLHQIRTLVKWWVSNGRTIADLDKPAIITRTGIFNNPDEKTYYRNGHLELNELTKVVTVKGIKTPVSITIFKIIKYFMANKGLCIPLPKIVKDIWNRDDTAGDQLFRVNISKVRSIIGSEMIISEHGHGYTMPDLERAEDVVSSDS